jgi:NTE family protein
MTDSIALSDSSRGYQRDDAYQSAFVDAAEALRLLDGWPNPHNDFRKELRADLALEGGGVKGIGLVGAVLVLDEAGYSFRGVAGTSAGAIAASIIAGLAQSDQPMTKLLTFIGTLDYMKFMPEGKLQKLAKHFKKPGEIVLDVATLAERPGLYSGDYLETWLRQILHDELNIRTFADLKLTTDTDSKLSIQDGRNYRLVVHTSDISRKELVRLPWDYPLYGVNADDQDPVKAVRASMSIPLFFEPFEFQSERTPFDVPGPSGAPLSGVYEAGSETWVDGGMLANFPIHAFDRDDLDPPRWPTIGIKLSRYQKDFAPTTSFGSSVEIALHCMHTMMSEWDSYSVDETTAARTIFVDHANVTTTEFDITEDQKNELFLNGVKAATEFIIEMSKTGVPRTSDEARRLAILRRHPDLKSSVPDGSRPTS